MYKIICKNLGFNCDFIITNNDKKIIVTNFEKHLQVDHKQHYQKKEIVALIDNQTTSKNIQNRQETMILHVVKIFVSHLDWKNGILVIEIFHNAWRNHLNWIITIILT